VRILYFGTYEREYPRNSQVISCLRTAGADVIERHVDVWDGDVDKLAPGLGSVLALGRAELSLLRRPRVDFDAVIVGYPGHFDMAVARRIAGDRPLVFNPLVSLEDTMVGDRRLLRRSSLRARVLHAVDRTAFRKADLVVADTSAHADFFVQRFGLPRDRLAVCFVGAEDTLFRPGLETREPFDVLFVGKLIPLHGLDTILAAAALLPEVHFRVVGRGQLDDRLRGAPANVIHETWVAYDQLPALYRSAGCALGIFGTSAKAARVIPNKAFQALATATPLITADTPAARELLTDGDSALLVQPGNAEALAAAVRSLASDPARREALGARGRDAYATHASEAVLGEKWLSALRDATQAARASAR
jgi:glycosyltransferase involved in cell wall biosynthesis